MHIDNKEEKIAKILNFYDSKTDELMTKVEEIRGLLDQIIPITYLMELATELELYSQEEYEKLNTKMAIKKFNETQCPVCFFVKETIGEAYKFINALDENITSKLDTIGVDLDDEVDPTKVDLDED